MWKYEQSTGHLLSDKGTLAGVGYSGSGVYKNRPDAQGLKDLGPIPIGRYTIGRPFDSDDHGAYCLALMPHIGNLMFDRSGFLMHGDSRTHPGTASKGCIVQSRATRELVGEGEDNELLVVPGPVAGAEDSQTIGGIIT